MEFGTIEREIYVEASPEIVFEVVSSPDHLRQWWPDDARYEPTPGSTGEIVFGDRDAGGTVVPFTVVDVAAAADASRSAGRTRPARSPAEGNSLLVTFDLTPSGGGTLLRMTETGFREMGWEVAVLEEQYQDHVTGWDFYLPRLAPYVATLAVAAVSTRAERSTTTSGRRSATRPGAGCSTCCCVDGGGTATTLGQQLPVTRQAVAKHLGVLDRVGLVRATPAGREKRYRVDDAQLARAVAQLASVGSAWDARLQRIKRIAEAIQRTQTEPSNRTDETRRTRWWTSCTGSASRHRRRRRCTTR